MTEGEGDGYPLNFTLVHRRSQPHTELRPTFSCPKVYNGEDCDFCFGEPSGSSRIERVREKLPFFRRDETLRR